MSFVKMSHQGSDVLGTSKLSEVEAENSQKTVFSRFYQ